MWPRNSTTAGDPRYNGAFRMNLAGPVDLEVLQLAFREIAQRHETLRTTFRVIDAEVQQVILPSPSLTVDVVDFRSFTEPDRSAMLDEISIQEAQQPFDLAQGVPVRIKLLRMADNHSVLTVTAHQIICDGWSIGLLMEELAADYTAIARHQPSPLAPLGFQYGDYVNWKQENSSWLELRPQLDYWKEKLDRCPQPRVDPDFSKAGTSAEAGIVSQLLERELTDALKALSQSENTTFYVVTMAACMVLLARYTGEPDIALRTPLAGRTRVEFEPIIGQFVNHVAIRARADSELTFSAFLERVRESVWEALANQDAPFDDVIRTVAPSAAVTDDLFSINFVCQREYGRNGPSNFALDNVMMTTLPSKSQGALYDLNFFLVEREARWRLSLEYKTGLYTQETAESLLQHFQEVLRQIADARPLKIAEIELSATEALTKRMKNDPAFSTSGGSITDEGASSEILAMPGSLAQERFWTLAQLDPANPSFHVPLIMEVDGPLEPSLLEKSFQLLIDRHESMRTTFAERDGEFLQIIHPSYSVALERLAIPGTSKSEKKLHVAAAIQKEILRPFDLAVLPLFRTLLCELGPEEHVLVITLHHILADAASAQIIQNELWTSYESLQSGKEPALAPLTVQYADFSVWQRESLDSDAMKAHLDFWLERLPADLKVLNFPTDHPPAYRPTSKGAVHTRLLPDDLTRALKQLAQSNEVTLYVVTLACFAAMLSRASETGDLTIGSPVLNRRQETEALIGPFAGPIALRLSLSGDPTLRDIVLATRDRTLEGLDHAEFPFELVLRNVKVRTQNDRRPLFQFYFLCQTAFVQSRNAGPLKITPMPSVSMGTPFEMQLAIIERSEGLRAELEYSADLFDAATIDRWLLYYQGLLQAFTSNPDQRLSQLPAPPYQASLPHGTRPETKTLKHAATASTHGEYVAPRDLVEEMVAQVWESVLGIPTISVHANFFDLGGTSLLILKLVPRINAAFELVLPVPTIFNAPTIELMANVLRKRHTIEKQVVLPLHPAGTRPPLFMIHSYHLYRALPAALGADQPFYGIMELELSDRHAPYTLKDQVSNYVQHIRAVQPKGPYFLAGFCFFGLIAFEVAAQLEALGEKVAFLGLIDTYCPEYWSCQHSATGRQAAATGSLIPKSSAPLWHQLRKTTGMKLGDKLSSHASFIKAKLRNRGLGLLLESRVKLYTYFISRQIKLPPWLKDPALVTRVGVRRHAPAKINTDLYLFPAEDVPLEADFDPTLGWGVMTSGSVRTLWIPGDHEDMFKEKNIGSMAKTIRGAMDRANDQANDPVSRSEPA
jgi:non-ribosomal peptide synthetase component F/thioesterase domain-containing protein